MSACRICGNRRDNRDFVLTEKMFGTGDAFDYFQCADCGCLQIADLPDRVNDLYGNGYYSFAPPKSLFDNPLKAGLKRLRTRCALAGKSLLPALFLKLYPPPEYFEWLRRTGARRRSAILDVGCGGGDLLVRLRKDGFENLTGVDPHIAADTVYDNGVVIYKKRVSEVTGPFDVIMLHHSFEHMPDPVGVMGELQRIASAHGHLVIRVPVATAQVWHDYGADWVQLDAPRHFFLHTEKSMTAIARRSGFRVEEIVYDSDAFQFWGSEQYRQGIALGAPNSLANGLRGSIFTKEQIAAYQSAAEALNRQGKGDQACFYLRKS